MEIAIKNMVCSRCVKVVKEILHQLAIPYTSVELGRVHIKGTFSAEQAIRLKERLLGEGFNIVEDKKLMIVEKIKNLIINLVYDKDIEEWNENLSDRKSVV